MNRPTDLQALIHELRLVAVAWEDIEVDPIHENARQRMRLTLRRAADALEAKLAAEREALAQELWMINNHFSGVKSRQAETMWLRSEDPFTKQNCYNYADRLLASGAITQATPLPTREHIEKTICTTLLRDGNTQGFNYGVVETRECERQALLLADAVLALVKGPDNDQPE